MRLTRCRFPVVARGLLLALAAVQGGCNDGPTATDGTGRIGVVVRTTGAQPDVDGYYAVVGVSRTHLAINDSADVRGVSPGVRTLSLEDVQLNCSTTDGLSRSVTLPDAGAASVRFDMQCVPAGSVTVRVHTTIGFFFGQPDGYTVRVEPGRTQRISPNGLITIAYVPAGERRVYLGEIDQGCRTDSSVVTVTVAADAATSIEFNVTCSLVTAA